MSDESKITKLADKWDAEAEAMEKKAAKAFMPSDAAALYKEATSLRRCARELRAVRS